VALVSIFTIALWVPHIPRIFGNRPGTPGFKVGNGDIVDMVAPGSPARLAGMQVGESH